MREIEFRAFWRDTLKPIPDFSDQYVIDACNDDVFIVEQYTGLKTNGKIKVFSGDKFMINNKVYYVEYIDDLCKYVLTTGKGYDTPNCMDLNCDTIFGLEVIGNIHENK